MLVVVVACVFNVKCSECTHACTSLHTHNQHLATKKKKKKKNFPRKHFQKLSFYLHLSHRASATWVLNSPSSAARRWCSGPTAQMLSGIKDKAGQGDLSGFLEPRAAHLPITWELLAPNSYPRRDRLAALKGPALCAWAAPLPDQEPGPPSGSGCPAQSRLPSSTPPAASPSIEHPLTAPGPKEPCCLRAPVASLRPLRDDGHGLFWSCSARCTCCWRQKAARSRDCGRTWGRRRTDSEASSLQGLGLPPPAPSCSCSGTVWRARRVWRWLRPWPWNLGSVFLSISAADMRALVSERLLFQQQSFEVVTAGAALPDASLNGPHLLLGGQARAAPVGVTGGEGEWFLQGSDFIVWILRTKDFPLRPEI